MITLELTNTHVRIEGAHRRTIRALDKAASYKVAGAQFVKAFQRGFWDGREHLLTYSPRHGYRVPIGLAEDTISTLEERGEKYKLLDNRRIHGERRRLQWGDVEPRSYQREAHRAILKTTAGQPLFGSGLLKMPIRSGKALAVSEPVLTPSGWKTMGDLREGDYVIGSDGKPTLVTGVFPQGAKELYRVEFDDDAHVACCAEHLWTLSRNKGASHSLVTETRTLGDWMRTSHFRNPSGPNGSGHLRLESVGAIESPPLHLPIDPYTFGVLLGDGTLSGTPVVSIGHGDEDIVEFMSPKPKRESFKGRRGCSAFSFGVKPGVENPLTRALRALKVWGLGAVEKFVPNAYMSAGTKQRHRLLQGLMDTDGSAGKTGATFSTHSPQLAWAVKTLARSLGGWASERSPATSGEITVCVKMPPGFPPFRCARKSSKQGVGTTYKRLMSVTPIGKAPAVCISVAAADGLFAVRDFTLTHNTKTLGMYIHSLGYRTLVIVPSKMLLHQTVESMRECFPGEVIGAIGDGHCDIRWITVATMQTLQRWKNREVPVLKRNGEPRKQGGQPVTKREPDPRYVELCRSVDVLAVDEAHHLRGDSEWHTVVSDFRARFRIALSATAYLDSEVEQGRGIIWLKACIGPQRIDISESRLIREGYLMAQNVRMIRVTKPTKWADWRWSVNLQREAIWTNRVRNQRIVDAARTFVDKGKRTLIVTNRLEHTAALSEMLWDGNVNHEVITGKDARATRAERVDEFVNGGLKLLVGTVLGEGVDIPECEVVIIAAGGRDAKNTTQRMRNMTVSEGKTTATLIDFIDDINPYLYEHSVERLKVYKSTPEFTVEVVE